MITFIWNKLLIFNMLQNGQWLIINDQLFNVNSGLLRF